MIYIYIYIYIYIMVDHDIMHVVWYHPFRDLQNEWYKFLNAWKGIRAKGPFDPWIKERLWFLWFWMCLNKVENSNIYID
jgi:hypothetical protein